MSATIGIAADIDASAVGVTARLVMGTVRAVKRVPRALATAREKTIANAMGIGTRSGIAIVRMGAAVKAAVPRAGVARVVRAKAAAGTAKEKASEMAIVHAVSVTAIGTRRETLSGKAIERDSETAASEIAMGIGTRVVTATARRLVMATVT